MTRPDLTPAERALYEHGYRDGAATALDYATRSAAAIESTSKRKLHEGFAVAALRGLVEECAPLLATSDGRKTA